MAELARETAAIRRLSGSKQPVERLHNGYFAQDKKGVLKDTRGDTQADDEVYNLIMKDKERLLSIDEPLRFIFSHSALREGWDNPNVFQICTLNETRSAMKKRQEIGRGLRLPVDQDGMRVFDESVNKLYVMANESYEDFARALQTEYEEDCGVTFGKVPITAFAKLTRVVDGERAADRPRCRRKHQDGTGRTEDARHRRPHPAGVRPKRPGLHARAARGASRSLRRPSSTCWRRTRSSGTSARTRTRASTGCKKEVTLSPEFQALWDRIKPKTTYRVEFETDELVRRAVDAIKRMEKIEAAEDPRQRRPGRRERGRRRAPRAVSVAEEQVAVDATGPCPTCWPTCRTRPS